MYRYNKKGPKRGIALYSYSGEYGVSMNLRKRQSHMQK